MKQLTKEAKVGLAVMALAALAFVGAGGIEAVIFVLTFTLVAAWSWWLYTFETKSDAMFYWVKVPANILFNPLLLFLLLGSWALRKFNKSQRKPGYLLDGSPKPVDGSKG